jgi:hypothetical protein
MLRITVHDDPDCTKFKIEGTLVGPWVHEAKECWQRTRATRHGHTVRFDLAGMTSIDAAGKEFLSAMHAEGAELIAYGCLMRAIVSEIIRGGIGARCSEQNAKAPHPNPPLKIDERTKVRGKHEAQGKVKPDG